MKFSSSILFLVASTATISSSVSAFSLSSASTFLRASSSSSSSSSLFAKPKVYIDGEAGTTGIQVRDRLGTREDLEVISIPNDLRKDPEARKKYINDADAVILCLPDDASKEAASWVENDRTVLIDASTAFRVAEDWVYGLPELSKEQREALSKTKRIANPGCYPTGFISLTRPLTDAGILPKGTPLTVNAISGYSGGGKGLMQLYQNEDHEPWGAYGFSLKHKHVPEMAKYSGLGRAPIFQPQVADFVQGMVVNVPLHYEWLTPGTTGEKMHAALKKHYEGCNFIEVMPLGELGAKEAGLLERGAFLRPDTLANTNKMQLFVFANDEDGQAVLSARLDNLGKGASGAAVQNLNIALGLDETTGLLNEEKKLEKLTA